MKMGPALVKEHEEVAVLGDIEGIAKNCERKDDNW